MNLMKPSVSLLALSAQPFCSRAPRKSRRMRYRMESPPQSLGRSVMFNNGRSLTDSVSRFLARSRQPVQPGTLRRGFNNARPCGYVYNANRTSLERR